MSLDISKAVWEGSRSKGSERLLLLAIADFADINGRAWPGITRLKKMTRLSERSIQALRKSLVRRGELTITKPGGGNTTNHYRIEVQTLRGRKDCPGQPDCTRPGQPAALQGGKLCGIPLPPAAPNPSGNRHRSIIEQSEEKRPSESDVKDYCKSIGLRSSDGAYYFNKFEGDGWPKNWQPKLKSYQSTGYAPSQRSGE